MTKYYVATSGSNSGTGSTTSPWKTIDYAMQRDLRPGDEVIVRPGIYNEDVTIRKSGTDGNHVILRSEIPGEAVIRATGYNAINVGANYVTVDGFDVSSRVGGNGIFGNGVHHVEVLNNTAHDSGESGIGFIWSEFIRIEGNESYGNAWKGWYSGISVWEFRNITGDTTTPGPRLIIRNNVSHDNVTKDGLHSDGNGIIIDDFHNEQNEGYPNYTFPTLVEGNLVYSNGGKGIAVHFSDGVTVINNTAYHNNVDLKNDGTYRGELSNQLGSNNVWANNIAVADPSINPSNTAIGFYSPDNNNVKWFNNLTFNGTTGQPSMNLDGGNPALTAANGNRLGVNPQFVNPASDDFNIRSGSPAIDAGNGSYVRATTDNDGGPRVIGTVDIGAFEAGSTGGTLNKAPVARADSGFATSVDKALTITAASLLANDSDPDGNPITLTGVNSASNGTVSLNASGNALFTPTAGYVGTAGFNYTIADGKGGTASASVSLIVNPAATVNAAPKFTSGTAFSVNENNTTAALLQASDAEGDALTFAKVTGSDAALFTLDSKTGALRFNTAPDFEKPADANRDNVYVVGVSVTDGKHAPTASTLQISVKNVAETPGAATTFFGSSVPAQIETRDSADYELGMKFTPTRAGDITALRYYRGAADASDTDTRTLHLWSATGTELAEATVKSAPGVTGWQTATLSSPVHVDAKAGYVVSYGTTQNYAYTENYFGTSMTNADGSLAVSAGAQGVFSDNGPGNFPTDTYRAANYWADVTFKPSTLASTAPLAPASAVNVWLIDATSDKRVLKLTDGAVVDPNLLTAGQYSIEAVPTGTAESIRFTTGAGARFENVAPFALFGDVRANFNGKSMPNGPQTVTVEAFAGDNGTGTKLAAETINFSFGNVVARAAAPGIDLQISSSSDRDGAQALSGAVLSDDAFVFATGTEGARSVAFWLDNPAATGTPTFVDRVAWHDYAGTASDGDANAWDTSKVTDGQHTITADVTLADGTHAMVTAPFVIDNF